MSGETTGRAKSCESEEPALTVAEDRRRSHEAINRVAAIAVESTKSGTSTRATQKPKVVGIKLHRRPKETRIGVLGSKRRTVTRVHKLT